MGEPILRPFLARLQARGYVEGRDFVLEARYGERSDQRIAELARELAALRPAVIVGAGNAAAEALKRATREVPIIAVGVNAPVETGLVESLAKPGGNVTGTSISPAEGGGKLVEMLKAAAPATRRVVVVVNPDLRGAAPYIRSAEATAGALRLELSRYLVSKVEEFRWGDLDAQRPDALYVTADQVVSAITPGLIEYALSRRLPSIGVVRRFATAGGLMSLGPDPDELEEVLVDYILRIVDGAAPSSLPVREPARFRLVLNRTTAREIGLTLSQEILLRAHEIVG
ncbi:MAG: ABC transporter substrate-binding protein [Burkholderiales bacterium]|nr:ABC transporter substrate-binding protein [Burkholderiales bacterium]